MRHESELERIKEQISKIDKTLEDDVTEEIKEFNEDLPNYDIFWDDNQLNSLWDYVMYFRWAINFLLVGIPMSQVIIWGYLWNVWFNIHLNNFWAHGNLYLMVMSLFVIMQSWNAMFLVFEIPAYLRWTKPFRSLSLEWGSIFNIIYLGFVFRYRQTVNAAQKKGDAATGIEIFENLFYLYNLVLHGPLFFVNLAIISKELSLEKW